jgi:hypothetical protein
MGEGCGHSPRFTTALIAPEGRFHNPEANTCGWMCPDPEKQDDTVTPRFFDWWRGGQLGHDRLAPLQMAPGVHTLES